MDKMATIDASVIEKAKKNLSDLNDISGTFRCHALSRRDYYKDQGETIVSLRSVIASPSLSGHKQEAKKAEMQFREESECRDLQQREASLL
jgi:hypothetical protein